MSKSLGGPALRSFFYEHLNRVYCAKSHLLERLSELEEQCDFEDLHEVIKATIRQAEQQVEKLNQVYQLLEETYTFEHCDALISFLEEIFTNICQQSADRTLRNAFVLSYLYYIESLEMASFRILIITAEKLDLIEILDLFNEIYADAKVDCALMLHLTEGKLAN